MANENNIDLRQLILTNELGDLMLNMVAPVYDRSKVALYLFQALGTLLSKDVNFMSLNLPNVPTQDSIVTTRRITNKEGGFTYYSFSFYTYLYKSTFIYRFVITDNLTGATYCDECFDIRNMVLDTEYKIEGEIPLAVKLTSSGYEMLNCYVGTIDTTADITLSVYKMDRMLTEEEKFVDNFISQIFIETATWGIPAWEREYGITPDPSWTLDQRRQNIVATLRYQAPITPKKLADRISAVLNIPVEVITSINLNPNTFFVILRKLILDYTPAKELIDRIAPAHLIYQFLVMEEDESDIGNYYNITVSEMESVTATVKYTVLADENDYILTNELGEVLTV